MTTLLVLTTAADATEVLPCLALLPHVRSRTAPPVPTALLEAPVTDVIVLDARADLVGARSLARLLRTTGLATPLVAVLADGGLIAVSGDWGVDDIVLTTAGPGEVDARLRLLAGRGQQPGGTAPDAVIRSGDLSIDEDTYQARLKGRPLDLTFKEFELLKYLAQHPGRVFSRAQLLQEVWGYDYYGGTRTVDVHVRRLRAKLGPEHEALIGTVRHVGYKFVSQPITPLPDDATAPAPAVRVD